MKKHEMTVKSLKKKGTVFGFAIKTRNGNWYRRDDNPNSIYFSYTKDKCKYIPLIFLRDYYDRIVRVVVNFNKDLIINEINNEGKIV